MTEVVSNSLDESVTTSLDKLSVKTRSQAWKGNARGLGKHEEETISNYTMLQAFEWNQKGGGVFWKDFSEKTFFLAEIGITAVWLPPPTKASTQEGNGYDIYDLYDLGEFDQKGGVRTKWGTKEEFLECVKKCKENGIVAYIDSVLNHKAGADETEKFKVTEVAEDDRNQEISGLYDIEGWTHFTFPGRKGEYSKLEWKYYHFTGVDFDSKAGRKSIYKIQGNGKKWSETVDKENGNFDYLMFSDIDHSHPEVIEDLLAWGEWVIKETGAAGFRKDAIKHYSRDFLKLFIDHVRAKTDNPDMFFVGEFWKDSLDSLTSYLDALGDTQFSIFDTPLHYNFKEASDQSSSYDLRKIFDGTLVQARPTDAVTLVDNHDTQPDEALESWIGAQFKPLAYSLILFRGDGYPCVFSGDLYGCDGENKVEPMHQLEDFIRIRKWFAYGPTRDYWDHPNCVGWVREGDEAHDGCAIVICNGTGEGTKRMQIPDGHAGEIWTDVLGWSQGEITIGDDGWAEFKSPAQSVSVWTKKDARGRETFGKK